jgi:hypothetical protein
MDGFSGVSQSTSSSMQAQRRSFAMATKVGHENPVDIGDQAAVVTATNLLVVARLAEGKQYCICLNAGAGGLSLVFSICGHLYYWARVAGNFQDSRNRRS